MNSFTSEQSGIMRFYKAMQDSQVRKLVSDQLPALKLPVVEHHGSEYFGGHGEYVGGHGEYTPFNPEFGTGYFGGFSSLHQESPETPKGNPTVNVTPETPTKAKPTKIPQTAQTPQTAKLEKEEEKDKPSEPTSLTSPAAATANLVPISAQDAPKEPPKTFLHECNEIYQITDKPKQETAFSNLLKRFKFNDEKKCKLSNGTVAAKLDELLGDCESFRDASQQLYVDDAAKFIKSFMGNDELAALRYAYAQERVTFGPLFNEDIYARLREPETYIDEIKSNVKCYRDLTVGRLSELYSIERAATIETFFTQCTTVWETKINSNRDLNRTINNIVQAHNDEKPKKGQIKIWIAFDGDISEKYAAAFKYRSKDCIAQQQPTMITAAKKYVEAYNTISVSDFYYLLKRELIAGQLSFNDLTLSDQLEYLFKSLERCRDPAETKSLIQSFVSNSNYDSFTAVQIWKSLNSKSK